VAGRAPDWVRDAIGPVRTAPGGRGNDAIIRAASATARCRGLAGAVVPGLAMPVPVPVPVRAPPGCGPNGWLPQPDRTTAAHAAADSRPGSRSRPDPQVTHKPHESLATRGFLAHESAPGV
jgi:hypothetical protein